MSKDITKDEYFQKFINIPLIRAGRRLQLAFYKDALAPAGMSIPEWRTLLYIEILRESHLRELARFGRLDPTHVSRATVELERKGYVRRFDDPGDQRRKRIAITQAGSATIARIWPQAEALDARVRAALGEARYEALRSALNVILEMDDLEPEGEPAPFAAE